MEYLTTKTGVRVEVDEVKGVARVIDIKELESQKAELEKRIAINPEPSDKELLEWAKVSYPYVNHSAEREELAKIETTLSSVKLTK